MICRAEIMVIKSFAQIVDSVDFQAQVKPFENHYNTSQVLSSQLCRKKHNLRLPRDSKLKYLDLKFLAQNK